MPIVTFLTGSSLHIDSERHTTETFMLTAVTLDGKVSERIFPSKEERDAVLKGLGAMTGYPPREFCDDQLREIGFDPTRLK